MKNLIHLFSLIYFVQIYSQVGVGTYTPDTSAALEISTHINPQDNIYRGVLIPRVDLVKLDNSTTPVLQPTDGTLVFNKTINPSEDLSKGLYFWNDNLKSWEDGLYYIETPKTSIIRFTGSPTDYFILDNGGAGYNAKVGTPDLFPDNFVYDTFAKFLGLKTYYYKDPVSNAIQNTISIAPGNYVIEISFACKAIPCNPSTSCYYAVSDYYYMGMFIDLFLSEYKSDGTVILGPRLRKEDGVISKTNEIYRITELYSVKVTGDDFKLLTRLGRMSGSTFNDGVYVIPSESYIKVSKF